MGLVTRDRCLRRLGFPERARPVAGNAPVGDYLVVAVFHREAARQPGGYYHIPRIGYKHCTEARSLRGSTTYAYPAGRPITNSPVDSASAITASGDTR